jgi:hypothetical protein
MPPLEAFGPAIAIGLILFVMLWFALGTQRNIAKGNDLLRWLQGGLPILGRRTTLRWLGSSAAELGIVEPAPPFRKATVVVVLEPRDVSLLWALGRRRGRRDFVIVRVDLVRSPGFDMDVRDPRGWTSRSERRVRGPAQPEGSSGAELAADPVGPNAAERTLDWPDGAIAVADGRADVASVRQAWTRLTESSAGVWRLTVQPVVPHLEVHVRPPASASVGAERLLGPIRDLAVALTER